MDEKIAAPKSEFLEVECNKCKEKTIIFSNISTTVNCENCGEEIALPTGGRAYIIGKVVKVLE